MVPQLNLINLIQRHLLSTNVLFVNSGDGGHDGDELVLTAELESNIGVGHGRAAGGHAGAVRAGRAGVGAGQARQHVATGEGTLWSRN